jgi:hypothetical protein
MFKARPEEWLHERKCLAYAIICSVENNRDVEGISDHDFRLCAQDNLFLAEADEFLRTGALECQCEADWPED